MIIPKRYADGFARHAAAKLFRKEAILTPPAPIVSFTFDDVPATAATVGADLLNQAGAHGTYYVAGGLIGKVTDYHATCASNDELIKLRNAGHEIACHTFSHRPLNTLSRTEINADLDLNAKALSQVQPTTECQNFSYPFNRPTLMAKRELRRRYTSARGGIPGVNRGRADLMFLKSIPLQVAPVDGKTPSDWIAETAEQKGWLIFFTHDIAEDHSPFGTTPEALESAIAEALAMGCEIRTVRSALTASNVPNHRPDSVTEQTAP
ncbi:MAG: polysaccharide deacetylase family protein [Pseudomonadota bacterium]